MQRIAPLTVTLAACLLGLPAPGAAQCEADGDVAFVCGPVSPEDLVAVPDTPWIVVSSMEDEGYLSLTDRRDHTSARAYPLATSEPRHDTATFGGCPGADTSGFRPHGLDLRPGDGGVHTLYVVRHGAREAVEVFELDAAGERPTLTWIGCVVAPESVSLNSVAALPGGGFGATNFNLEQGQVWEWQPGAGWTAVPGSETVGPNGLVASPDGRWFYIGGWGTRSLIRVSRGQSPPSVEAVDVGFQIDNVRWAPDGSLLAAGHLGSDGPASIFACLGERACDGVTSRVATVDPEALTAQEIVRYPSNDHLILATVALQVGDEIWVGGIGGSDRIARFNQPATP